MRLPFREDFVKYQHEFLHITREMDWPKSSLHVLAGHSQHQPTLGSAKNYKYSSNKYFIFIDQKQNNFSFLIPSLPR